MATITFNAQGGQINKLVRPDDEGNSWSMYRCCLVNNFNEYKANVNLFPDNTPLNVDKEILEDKDYFDDTVDQSLEEDEEIMSYTNPSHRTTDPTYDMESRMSIESMLESGVDVIKANGNFFMVTQMFYLMFKKWNSWKMQIILLLMSLHKEKRTFSV